MKNLKLYRQNGYNDNYVVVLLNETGIETCKTYATRKAAENYNSRQLNGTGEVLTFRQAARMFPDYFKYN